MGSEATWGSSQLGDLAEDWKQTWKPSESEAESVDHYSIPAFDQGKQPSQDRPADIKSNKRVVPPDAVLLSRLNPSTPRVWAPTLHPERESVCSTEMLVLRPREGVDRGYLHYLCWSPHVSVALLERVSGTTGSHQRVSPRDVLSLPVPVPPIEEQRAIAEVLGTLDDRIEWCASTSALVLDMSDALWGRAVAADGEEVLLDEIVSFLNRRRIPLSAREREARPGPFPYYGATGVFCYVDDFLFDGNYVLVGEDGSVVNDDGTAVVQYATGRFWVNNHAHVLESERLTAEELFLALRRTVVTGYVTGAAQPKLSMGRLKQVPLRIPSAAAVDGLREAVTAQFARHRAAAAEAASLRDTRDALLPRLLSGELRIEDPARVLGAVA
jgi:type I restriction enzyme S subunit